MLRNVLIIGGDGIVLFDKSFINDLSEESIRRLGSVLTAVLTSCKQQLGFPPFYLEFEFACLSLVTEANHGITGIVIYDPEDGETFGKLMATEIVTAFAAEYGETHSFGKSDAYQQFNITISDTIRNSVNVVLQHLQEQRGIQLALLITGDKMAPSRLPVDKLGVFANLESVLSDASDIMSHTNDNMLKMSFNGKDTSLIIRKVQGSTLVVQCESRTSSRVTDASIESAYTLLQRIILLISSLQDSWER